MSGNRLYPKKNSGRYYILTLLREVNEHILTLLSEKSKILDYGCGNMPYKQMFENRGHIYIGADFENNLEAEVKLKDGGLPLKNDSYDCVISTQVLEHVDDPNSYLQESFRVLKKGGLLLLSTHGHWKYHPDPTDYWRWTKDGLNKVLIENGFKPIKYYGLMGLAASGLQLFQDGAVNKFHYRLRKAFFRLILLLQIKFDKWNWHNEDASVFYFVCEKNKGND